LQRFEKLDDGILVVRIQLHESCTGCGRFAAMGHDRLPQRGELSEVKLRSAWDESRACA
jgi:hypothetical protein